MRTFDTGATRHSDEGKLDYEGFLSPLVLRRVAEYMNEHRVQADGKLRDSDNWQKGIPLNAYMKSMWRHFMELWAIHRGYYGSASRKEEALCAVLFNASGYLHEMLSLERPVGAPHSTHREPHDSTPKKSDSFYGEAFKK